MDGTVYLLSVTALTVFTLVARVASRRPRVQGPFAYGLLAYARGGRHAVIQSVLAVLYAQGFVEVWHPGLVMLTEESAKASTSVDETERAVCAGLVPGPAGPRLLAARPPVLRELDSLRAQGVAAGLLRAGWVVSAQRAAGVAVLALSAIGAAFDAQPPMGHASYLIGAAAGVALGFLPRRTAAGRDAVAAARADSPVPTPAPPRTHPVSPPVAEVGMAVALYGSAALLAMMPRFARDAGPFDRQSPTDADGDVTLDKPNRNGYGTGFSL